MHGLCHLSTILELVSLQLKIGQIVKLIGRIFVEF